MERREEKWRGEMGCSRLGAEPALFIAVR